MATKFEEIMNKLLEAYESNPEIDINTLIKNFCKEQDVSEQIFQQIEQTNQVIDDIQMKKSSIIQAKKEGKTTKRWIMEETNRQLTNYSPEEKTKILSTIADSVEQSVIASITTEPK